MPRFAEIRLADGANCFMIQNKTVEKKADRLPDYFEGTYREFWRYVDELSCDEEDVCHDFEIEGGIWNFNNLNQKENPIWTRKFYGGDYQGYGMFFYNVKNFRISNLTLKDPVNYAVDIANASHFTVENITFDFNDGNPIASNMDGIHIDGNCHFGVIRNLRGACYDDLVALNAHEGLSGDITNIQIDGIFAKGCHSAVRLLTVVNKIENVSISNVYGTYYQYCIGFTKHYRKPESTGYFSGITLDNIHASKSKRLPIQEAHMGDWINFHYPFIWIQGQCHIKNLVISNLYRHEYENSIDTFRIDNGTVIDSLTIRNMVLENDMDCDIRHFVNDGLIKKLYLEGMEKEDVAGEGKIEKCHCFG